MIAWNINGRIPGSIEYFASISRPLSKVKKYDNALYLVATILEKIMPLENDAAILEHLATLKQPLEFVQAKLRKDIIDQGLEEYIQAKSDSDNLVDWRTTLVYISDRWLDEDRIQWMLNLITLLEEKIIIGEQSQMLYGINDIKEMEGLI